MPTADDKSPVCLKFRRQTKNKALVLPGSGRCYLSLGGARTEPMGWGRSPEWRLLKISWFEMAFVSECRFGKKVVLMTL